LWGDDPQALKRLCKEHYDAGHSVLLLTDTKENIAWLDSACGDLVREDRAAGHRRIRVRSFHKAKALEAEVVILIGDPSGGSSSWFRNQLYKLAGFATGGDLTPGDTVLANEARRLVALALARATKCCHWFPMAGPHSNRTASTLTTLPTGLFKDNRD
jgi:superfamily I DNA/RNA helicase